MSALNDRLLIDELAAILRLDSRVAALIPHLHVAGSGEVTARPSLVLAGSFKTYRVTHRMGVVVFTLRSRVCDEEAAAVNVVGHQAQFDALHEKLLGGKGVTTAATLAAREAAKAALKLELLNRGKVSLIDYGLAPEGVRQLDATEDLRSTLSLAVCWAFV
ncbi:MAG: hypothetical protein ABMA13_20590 [Chthoniobacteraceae bacterium]